MYKFRKTITILWFIFIAFCLGFYLIEHDRFTPEAIKLFLDQFGTKAKWIYFLFGLVRGFTFLPTTVMAIGGGALFPENPWLVFAMCMIGVMVSRTLLYFFSDWLGADDFFTNKYQSKIDWLEKNLQKYGMPVVIGWAMFPFVPTDLICYVAGTFKMKFWKFFLALLIGEIPIIALYVFFGGKISQALGIF